MRASNVASILQRRIAHLVNHAPLAYIEPVETAPLTVVETAAFIRSAEAVLTSEERVALIDTVAADPTSGVSLGGGLYKLRFGTAGRGKSGSARVIYFYANGKIPVFLLTVFAKNQQANLTPAEKAALLVVAKKIADTYGKGA